jgi:hypothetical protein
MLSTTNKVTAAVTLTAALLTGCATKEKTPEAPAPEIKTPTPTPGAPTVGALLKGSELSIHSNGDLVVVTNSAGEQVPLEPNKMTAVRVVSSLGGSAEIKELRLIRSVTNTSSNGAVNGESATAQHLIQTNWGEVIAWNVVSQSAVPGFNFFIFDVDKTYSRSLQSQLKPTEIMIEQNNFESWAIKNFANMSDPNLVILSQASSPVTIEVNGSRFILDIIEWNERGVSKYSLRCNGNVVIDELRFTDLSGNYFSVPAAVIDIGQWAIPAVN